jgi:hypothetical protein
MRCFGTPLPPLYKPRRSAIPVAVGTAAGTRVTFFSWVFSPTPLSTGVYAMKSA